MYMFARTGTIPIAKGLAAGRGFAALTNDGDSGEKEKESEIWSLPPWMNRLTNLSRVALPVTFVDTKLRSGLLTNRLPLTPAAREVSAYLFRFRSCIVGLTVVTKSQGVRPSWLPEGANSTLES